VELKIPELSLVCLVGVSGCGKSTFAAMHFRSTEVLSSDRMRGLVSDDENDQTATPEAFEALHFLAAKRLARGKLTVVDATNVQPMSRKPLLALARQFHVMPVAIVFNIAERVCEERNSNRPDRAFGPHVIRRQSRDLRQSISKLEREGFRYVFVLTSPEEVDEATIRREPMWTDRKAEHGPFDIFGDIHGCYDELAQLLTKLGYVSGVQARADGSEGPMWSHSEGRKAVFVGDLVDRGPKTPEVLKLVMGMVAAGDAICVPGNHEHKLLRKLRGRDVQLTHGLAETLAQLESEPPEFRNELIAFLDSLISHYVLDEGKLVVAHAGLPADMQGRASGAVRNFALYGETSGETDEYGLPVRYNWARDYRGTAAVVYGHTPVPTAEWENNTICLDTGCVFGGSLTALRFPERELVSVPAARVYYEPVKPFSVNIAATPPVPAERDDWLRIDDVIGRRMITTALSGTVVVKEEHAAAALEVMSRFAIDPRWLIYLPPTMSPVETSRLPGLLEHPAEAFTYFRSNGVARVVCQEKHMGSRMVAVVCRNLEGATQRFGVGGGPTGALYTRTGRRFFDSAETETRILERMRAAVESSGLWDELASDWMILDCELLPWSAKAEPLIRNQYASVGAAAAADLGASVSAMRSASPSFPALGSIIEDLESRAAAVAGFRRAYRHYSWDVTTADDLKVAPFHLLASEGAVHSSRDHGWHMEVLNRLCAADLVTFRPTPARTVDVTSDVEMDAAIQWWEESTAVGVEGMVVKPWEFIARGKRGLIQPALKVRGPEYLRLIYGPEYSLPRNLERLRSRGVGAKRGLAQREFALGIEGLTRFVHNEPLHRVHECVFGVLAMESEPVDPRL
jgi:protein phosphatase